MITLLVFLAEVEIDKEIDFWPIYPLLGLICDACITYTVVDLLR